MLVLVYFQRNSEGVFDFMEKGEEDHIIRLNWKFVDTMTRCQFCDSSFWMTWLALLNRFPSSVGQNIISSLQFYKSDFGIHHAIRMQIDSSNWSRKKVCNCVAALAHCLNTELMCNQSFRLWFEPSRYIFDI